MLSCSCLALNTNMCLAFFTDWRYICFHMAKTTYFILLRILGSLLKLNVRRKFLPRLHQLELSSVIYSDCAHSKVSHLDRIQSFVCLQSNIEYIVNIIIAQHNVLILGQIGSISLCVLIVARHVSRQIGQDMARTSNTSSNASLVLLVTEEDVSRQI